VPVTTSDWLLLFHLLAAFAFVSGSVAAGVLHLGAMRRERPSEIALLLGLVRPLVPAIGVASLATLGFGIWLTQEAGPDAGLDEAWVTAAIALWVASVALATLGGRMLRHARELAEGLGRSGDRPSEELHRAVADPRALVLNYLSFAALLAIVVLMVFKPGAG
jgi:uncharacterized membrane protein